MANERDDAADERNGNPMVDRQPVDLDALRHNAMLVMPLASDDWDRYVRMHPEDLLAIADELAQARARLEVADRLAGIAAATCLAMEWEGTDLQNSIAAYRKAGGGEGGNGNT